MIMKIAMIGQKGIPAVFGGIERHVEELSARLVRHGMNVVVYCRPWYCKNRTQNVQGVRTVFLPSIHTKNLDTITHTLLATVHALLREKPDVIHYHGVGPALLSWIPRILSPRTRVVVTFHSVDRMHDKWGRFARLMLRLGEWSGCRNADRTIAVSNALRRYCHEVYDTEVTYLPNGCTSFPEASPAELTEWNLVPGHYLLFVGRIIPLKGLHTLLQAYRQLPERLRAEYPLVISGAVLAPGYLRELTRLSRGLNVKFVGNQVGASLGSLYRHAAAFVQPSETESMPIVVLEAASFGLPIVASDIEAHREILGGQGVYFESKNALDLSLALNRILENLETYRVEAKAFAGIVRATYDWDRIAAKTKDVYLETAPLTQTLAVAKEA